MPDDFLSAAERYRSDAAKFSELAKDAANPFLRAYYERLAHRYLTHAENQEKIAKIAEGSIPVEADPILPDSPSIHADAETLPPEEASVQPTSSTPLQPTQGRTRAARRSRRRRPVS
jgi:hypothetical protein